MTRVLCVGECMLELTHLDSTTARLGIAGDTYNTAVYLRRVAQLLCAEAEVGYLTGLGTDQYSADMRARWLTEGVVDHSLPVEGGMPGLYTVRVDDDGERRFSYWRSHSAARKLFAGTDWAEHITGDLVHLSGITLQIASAPARQALSTRLRELRLRGTLVSFDTNYRPSGWCSPADAADAMDQFTELADIVFASWEDETALHDCPNPAAAAARLAALGPREVIVKTGADGAHLLTGGRLQHTPAAIPARVLDTTAAGDSFAGAYLAARITGRAPAEALRTASEVAAVVIAHPGAITPGNVPLLSAG
ncbi:sugar kinase [Streptomyces sporangiiformans]|uniref:Sugar kinase n=1 Tax=Streptomyces sporangiiformans TaxID=2315329 RepID=A0A505DRH5_9ACTN|nr:sugar kinase [Streptomyces sporangiiformans]TPQ23820.1 sugar kinase [Streptomyces sporangiiformans]